MKTIAKIHESLVLGQRRQAIEWIDEYGPGDFFPKYKQYLDDLYQTTIGQYDYFSDMTISYFRIKGR